MKQKKLKIESQDNKGAVASLSNVFRIFTVPETPYSTLGKIDTEITQNLTGFLRQHIVASEMDLEKIEKDFSDPKIPDLPTFVSDYAHFLMDNLVAQSVHTAAPGFVGHMTSALPSFMLPLSRIMTALNQNLVKIETSKAFTPMERQVLGMLHHLVYRRKKDYYKRWMHDCDAALGAFCSGGTVSNITALWAARNNMFPAVDGFRGVANEGIHRALRFHGYTDVAILISRLGHYSFGKTADVLGIGRESLVSIDTDRNNRIDLRKLKRSCRQLNEKGIKILSLVGIAGTTETGNVDPLAEMADIAEEFDCHFHVDAAWGGPTLFSERYKHLLNGIERADSVTIDAHKQLYVPMGAGMVLFKNPTSLSSIEHHAEYVLRKGSKDLGTHTLEGSRPGKAMLVHSALRIIGRRGYELLIDQGIEKARMFADLIEADAEFELVTQPELNLLTYRYVPAVIQQALSEATPSQLVAINKVLDKITRRIQKLQRAAGKTFVSRTRLNPHRYNEQVITVFRVVLANPLTTNEIMHEILVEQKAIAAASKKINNQIAKLLQKTAA